MLETEKDVVEIRDIDATTMMSLLDFMYTSTIEITVNNVQNLLQVNAFMWNKKIILALVYVFHARPPTTMII